MDKSISADTPENWDSVSGAYADRISPMIMALYQEEFVDRLNVDGQSHVLEVAAGSGALTMVLCKKVKTLLATDFSPKMIGLLENRLKENGIGNVSCEVMDGQALSLKENSFDGAASSFGLMHFTERDKGFSELSRVVRPGGKVMVSGWSGPDTFEAFALFVAAMQAAFPDMPTPSSPPSVFRLANLDSFRTEMENAGFKKVEVDYVPRDVTISSFEDFWGMLSTGVASAKVLFDRVGLDGKHRLHDALADIIRQRFGNSPIITANVATVATGVAG